jgi:hypothetical protein
LDVAVTLQTADKYGRPPFPYDPVASSVRFAQESIDSGAQTTTVGEQGFSGARAVTVASVAAGFEKQSLTVQNALSLPERSVTPLPTLRI